MAKQLKLYYNLMSQPATSVYLFLKVTNIPFTANNIALNKGDHLKEEYLKINPFHKVPVLDDNGFILTESAAILKYIAQNAKVADHWYPRDLKNQTRVDEYLSWHHADVRYTSHLVFLELYLFPKRKKSAINWENVKVARKNMEKTVEHLDKYFLKSNPYLCGNEMSIADISGICELMTLYASGEEYLYESNANVNAWTKRVKDKTQPHFDEAHAIIYGEREKIVKWLSNQAKM